MNKDFLLKPFYCYAILIYFMVLNTHLEPEKNRNLITC